MDKTLSDLSNYIDEISERLTEDQYEKITGLLSKVDDAASTLKVAADQAVNGGLYE